MARAGRVSSLAQLAVKLFAPGVPDVYQGTELWDLSLVDPDNRRPVDFDRRRRLLEELSGALGQGQEARAALARDLSAPEALADGRAKLLLLRAGLHARASSRALFLEGEYRALAAEGPLAAHLFAFARVHAGKAALCAVPRLVLGLLERGEGRIRWEGALPLPDLPRRWRDVVTGAIHEGDALPLARLHADFPVSLLLSE